MPDYYVPWLTKQQKTAKNPKLAAPGNCSAFIATGSMTKDHKIVIAHNNWTSYLAGERWVIDVRYSTGAWEPHSDGWISGRDHQRRRFRRQLRGHDGDETTITQFEGWDPNGKPEFMRSRKALQYATASTTTFASSRRQ